MSVRGRARRVAVVVPPEVERQVVREYADPAVPLRTICQRHGITAWTLNTIRLKWGLRRNRTNADPRHATLQRAIQGVAPWDAVDDQPRWRRCEHCGGREATSAPHRHGRAA